MIKLVVERMEHFQVKLKSTVEVVKMLTSVNEIKQKKRCEIKNSINKIGQNTFFWSLFDERNTGYQM